MNAPKSVPNRPSAIEIIDSALTQAEKEQKADALKEALHRDRLSEKEQRYEDVIKMDRASRLGRLAAESGVRQRRRSKAEHDQLKIEVYRLHLLGKSNRDIAYALHASEQHVSNIINGLDNDWRRNAKLEVDAMRREELAKLDAMEQELWSAWELSKKGTVIITQSSNEQFGDSTTTKSTISGVGNVVYMTAIQAVISQRMKIVGGYAPTVIVHDFRAVLEEAGVDALTAFEFLVGAIVSEQGARIIEGSFSEAERRAD